MYMGQAEVIELLQNHPRQWFTATEISLDIDLTKVTVCGLLKRLKQQGVVEKQRNPEERRSVQYRIKQ
jgi:DNA-binding MarR family transcriptional regulator